MPGCPPKQIAQIVEDTIGMENEENEGDDDNSMTAVGLEALLEIALDAGNTLSHPRTSSLQ